MKFSLLEFLGLRVSPETRAKRIAKRNAWQAQHDAKIQRQQNASDADPLGLDEAISEDSDNADGDGE